MAKRKREANKKKERARDKRVERTMSRTDQESTLLDSEPKLRLFFSADISDSTKYKSNNKSKSGELSDWVKAIKNFVEIFPTKLKGFNFWKFNGDELLFYKDIESPEIAYELVNNFYQSLIEYDTRLYKANGLRLKGTVFSAGFPVRNSSIKISSIKINDSCDFIGPDIDLGFRLTGCSRPGEVVISLDVLDIIYQSDHREFDYYHLGWEKLKGVYNDCPYPVIYIRAQGKPVINENDEIWEQQLCKFKREIKEEMKMEVKGIENLLSKIRNSKSLKNLELISPYFPNDKMPEEHEKWWKDYKEDIRDDEPVYEMENENLNEK